MDRAVWRATLAALCVLLHAGTVAAQSNGEDAANEHLEGEPPVGFVRPGLATPGLSHVWGGLQLPTGFRPASEQRWEGIVRQRLEPGCGPASLATLYTYYLDLPVSEAEMTQALTAVALRLGRDHADIRNRGYSIGEVKEAAERGRLVTAVFHTPLESLPKLKIPAITQIDIRGYGHFVVIRGVVGDRVVVADPAFGNLTYPIGQFGKIWSRILLAIGRPRAPVTGLPVDASHAPTVQEIDYRTFQEASMQLPPGNRLRFALGRSELSFTFRPVVQDAAVLEILQFERTITEWNSD